MVSIINKHFQFYQIHLLCYVTWKWTQWLISHFKFQTYYLPVFCFQPFHRAYKVQNHFSYSYTEHKRFW